MRWRSSAASAQSQDSAAVWAAFPAVGREDRQGTEVRSQRSRTRIGTATNVSPAHWSRR